MAKKILVVDDEPHVVRVVENRLKANGYEVITADNGLDGLARAKKEKPDLIILDIMMPKMDGQEVLKNLRQNKDTEAIPVIMLTAKTEGEDIVKSLIDGGAVEYIVKPFTGIEIMSKIGSKLNLDAKQLKDHREGHLLDRIENEVKKAVEKKQNLDDRWQIDNRP
ncbi:MAG: response regulator [Candidatus Omnitrophota bacterium]